MTRPSVKGAKTKLFGVLAAAVLSFTLVQPVSAETNGEVLTNLSNSLNAMRTMQGDFVQFGPNGGKTEGVFAISRPGKLHFRYDPPAKIQIVSDGKSVVIHDRALQTWDLWPLKKTPLRFLLSDNVDFLNDPKIQNIVVESDIVSISMLEESRFGDSRVTLLFDRATHELRQWTVTDAQGLDTTVAVYNLKGGMKLSKKLFKIPYGRIAMKERE
ncbi:MAG: outer-membrane lipoprotein carrier protein LolA [Rhizobiales bacterium]|nr:outer-membrane lipoprotein carrier protein LolA [Hyphomicrobiales bacterium]